MTGENIRLRYLIPLLGVAAVACTATVPFHINMTDAFSGTEEQNAITSQSASGHLMHFSIVDERSDKKTLGSHDTEIYGTGVTPWVRSGIESLPEISHLKAISTTNSGKDLHLKIAVNRVSCRVAYQYLRCTVVLGVNFMSDGVVIKEDTYYGSDMREKTIWSNSAYRFSETDIIDSLNVALSKSLIKLEPDIRIFCCT